MGSPIKGAARQSIINIINDKFIDEGIFGASSLIPETSPKNTFCPILKNHAKATIASKRNGTNIKNPTAPPISTAPIKRKNLLQKQENGGTPVNAKNPIIKAVDTKGIL